MAVIGVIPAAGFGTRLGLQGPSKEMVLVHGRPVMDYCVERIRVANADSIRLVTRPAKEDVTANAIDLGLNVIHAQPRSAAHSIAIAMDALDPDDIVLIGFPDTIWEPLDGFRTLAKSVLAGSDIALGLFGSTEPERSDVVLLGADGRVSAVLVKPADPPSNQIWGCAAARRRALQGMGNYEQPGELFDRCCQRLTVSGIWLSDSFVDIGTTEQLVRLANPPATDDST